MLLAEFAKKYPKANGVEISLIDNRIDDSTFDEAIRRIQEQGWEKGRWKFVKVESSRTPINILSTELATQFKAIAWALNSDERLYLDSYQIINTSWQIVINKKEIALWCLPVNKSDNANLNTKRLFALIFHSLFFTPSKRDEVISTVNVLLDAEPANRLNLSKITTLSTLTFNDLRFGGIIGEVDYFISEKADGKRVFVYIEKDGSVFLLGTSSFVLASRNLDPFLVMNEYLPILFEAEYIGFSQRRKNGLEYTEDFYLIAYDCLAVSGKSLIKRKLNERLLYRDRFIMSIVQEKAKNVRIALKAHRQFSNASQFFAQVNGILHNTYNYETDGLVFTPGNSYLDNKLFKWKPFEKNTIDLLFKKQKWFYFGKNSIEEIEIDAEIPKVENRIYELSPTITNDNSIFWKILKERTDRRKPNFGWQIEIIFKFLKNPIAKETLIGNDFELYKHYHRREKGVLLTCPKVKETLLDIGSGRLGDLHRWKAYKKVFALEPNPAYRSEWAERLQDYNGPEIFELAQEASEQIRIEPVDVISMMFSLTFFGKDEKTLNKILNNIDRLLKPGGYLLLATFDGDLIQSAFNDWVKYFDVEKKVESLVFPPGERVTIEHSINEVNSISFPTLTTIGSAGETTVIAQKEYPVFMTLFCEKLKRLGINLVDSWIFDREILLNPTELYLTRLFSGWVYQRVGELKEKIMKIESCQMLPEGQVEDFGTLYGYQLKRRGVIAEGSCLIHSILSLIDDDYVGTTSEKMKRAKAFRSQMANELTPDVFNSLSISTIASHSGAEFSRPWMISRLRDSSVFLGFEDVEYLSKYFQINLVFLTCNRGTVEIYKLAQGKKFYRDEYNWILLLWVGESHFEPVSTKIKDVFLGYLSTKSRSERPFIELLQK